MVYISAVYPLRDEEGGEELVRSPHMGLDVFIFIVKSGGC